VRRPVVARLTPSSDGDVVWPTGSNSEGGDGSPVTKYVPETRKRAIALKLTVIARQLGQHFDQAVERDGLSRAKWSVIVAIARSPGATQRSIASMLEVSEVTAGQLIDRLCADGYLERREHPKDRRAYCLHLTDAARPLLERLGEVAKLHEEETFAGIESEDLVKLDELLDKVARNLAVCRTRKEEEKKSSGH
jgi:MarR family transcriptional regulator, transcriptional regulator for hemolysin